MFIEKFQGKVSTIKTYDYDDGSFKESLAEAYVTQWSSTIEDSVWTSLPDSDKEKLKKKVNTAIQFINSFYRGF
jgi:hypothetical protein